MNLREYRRGRELLAELVAAWPGPPCDALEDARYYLAHSCPTCGAMLWPTELLDRRRGLVVVETLCEACASPAILPTIDDVSLLEALRDVALLWPGPRDAPAYVRAAAFFAAARPAE